jgi:hypothetical protein
MRLLPLFLVLSCCAPTPLAAWGRQGHQIAAALALRDLPPALSPWFQGQEATLRDHCDDPDAWKRHDHLEGTRHFLDADAYGGPDGVPRAMDAARATLGEADFERDGQLPWVIQDRVRSLAQAWGSGDPARVAWEAAILCHYVGDLSVPLHTCANHDGQATGQPGVHDRWETGLVERLGAWEPEGRAAALDGVDLDAPWAWLKQANALVVPLLRDDLEASGSVPRELQGDPVASAYWTEFNRRQGPVVREQLELAGQRTAQMILLAWHLAGEPAAPWPVTGS